MRLLVIRHGIAEDPATFSGPDEERPLTDKGRRRMRQVARGLRRLVPDLELVATSPLLRATQTAEIVAGAYEAVKTIEVAEASPGRTPDDLWSWLAARREDTIAVVGHEPGLSRSVGHALAGADRSLVELKKGAACFLDVAGSVAAGQAVLLWALTPGQLRRLG